MNKKKEEK